MEILNDIPCKVTAGTSHLIGMDAFITIQHWKRYWEIIRLSDAGVAGERCSRRRWTAAAPMGSLGSLLLSRLLCSLPLWVFALKLKTFYDLGYSGDLFAVTQLARSWLEGRGLLHDNCFGNYLAIHTYFFLLPLGLIAKPFGAPGLLFVLAASVGVTYFWAARILRLLGVDGRVAIIAAGALLISPLSVAFYQEAGNGFYVETLALALCLILFYFLLQQRTIASIVTAIAVISVKEDAPIAAAMVAIVAGVETWLSSQGKPARCRFNWPAVITLILSVSAIPVLLAISSAQSPTTYARSLT